MKGEESWVRKFRRREGGLARLLLLMTNDVAHVDLGMLAVKQLFLQPKSALMCDWIILNELFRHLFETLVKRGYSRW